MLLSKFMNYPCFYQGHLARFLRKFTRAPCNCFQFIRLACIKLLTSVHPEPGSNSSVLDFVHYMYNFLIFLLFFPIRFMEVGNNGFEPLTPAM